MDIHLHYMERGTGTPFILLHGNGESSDYFRYQIDFFARNYRVIAVDTRGHGKSPRGAAPFTLTQFAEDLKDFLEQLCIPKANILGFSDGGNIALLFALKYPDKVGRLILNGANLHPTGVKASVQLPICMNYGLTTLLSLFDRKAAAKKELLGLMVSQPDIRPEELSELDMPVLVIAGKNDMIREAHTRKIASAIPNAELRLIEGDHFIARKSNDLFNKIVSDFLS